MGCGAGELGEGGSHVRFAPESTKSRRQCRKTDLRVFQAERFFSLPHCVTRDFLFLPCVDLRDLADTEVR
jgi:hypothetical protein